LDTSVNTFGYHFPLVQRPGVTAISSRDLGTNDVRGSYSGTGVGTSTSQPNRAQRLRWHANENVSYFNDKLFGASHNFKFGYMWLHESQRVTQKGPIGNVVLYYRNGVPDSIATYNSPFKQNNAMRQNAFFAQDKLQIGKKLTLNVGVRFDRY